MESASVVYRLDAWTRAIPNEDCCSATPRLGRGYAVLTVYASHPAIGQWVQLANELLKRGKTWGLVF